MGDRYQPKTKGHQTPADRFRRDQAWHEWKSEQQAGLRDGRDALAKRKEAKRKRKQS